MDEVSRTRLELFIEQAEELIKYCRTVNNMGGLMSIFRRTPEEEWQTHQTIRGMLSLFCRFIEERDGIALYVLGQDKQGNLKPSPLLKLTDMSAILATGTR
jgi:hypothetical protein